MRGVLQGCLRYQLFLNSGVTLHPGRTAVSVIRQSSNSSPWNRGRGWRTDDPSEFHLIRQQCVLHEFRDSTSFELFVCKTEVKPKTFGSQDPGLCYVCVYERVCMYVLKEEENANLYFK